MGAVIGHHGAYSETRRTGPRLDYFTTAEGKAWANVISTAKSVQLQLPKLAPYFYGANFEARLPRPPPRPRPHVAPTSDASARPLRTPSQQQR